MKNPFLAALFSILVPGLGQLYLGENAKGWTLLSMTAGVVVSLVFSHTPVAWILMAGIYLAVMIPAALDAFQTASGRPRSVVDPPQSVGGSNSRSNLRTARLRDHLTTRFK